LQRLQEFPFSPAYSDFIVGKWGACSLWNRSGTAEDGLIRRVDGPPQPTGLLASLPYLARLLPAIWNLQHVRAVRVFILWSGVVLPHRDFLDLGECYTRMHLVLKTHAGCLHSEAERVYHMGEGEVWLLDAEQVHAACNTSASPRIHVCVDCAPRMACADLLAAGLVSEPEAGMTLARAALSAAERREIQDYARSIDRENFRQILGRLAMRHFHRNVSPACVYDWLDHIARDSAKAEVMQLAAAARKLALGETL
jgi:hypothetical protein